jgi:BirA family biotin operon repressor/biotin-[acetyl-CoA-carboxylase] ligase
VDERRFFEEIPSTQTEAVRLARTGAPDGTRVVARRQTAGVGRLDHRWASPDGGLYLSIVLQAPRGPSSLVALAVGAVLRDRLAKEFSVPASLKWPNDLYLTVLGRGRKLSGILADGVESPTLGRAVVVGVGLNVHAPREAFPEELRAQTASLAEVCDPVPSLDQAEKIVVGATDEAVRTLSRPEGVAQVIARVRSALYGRGRTATVDRTLRGVIRTVGDEGELWLETPDGMVAVRAGDLVVEEAS